MAEAAYQTAWQQSGKRQVPDVAYAADPNAGFPVYTGIGYSSKVGWLVVGGTSAGAPQWAALSALVNAGRASGLAMLHTALYTSGQGYFVDITAGSNGFPAIAGYDKVTGLGTPRAQALVSGLTVY